MSPTAQGRSNSRKERQLIWRRVPSRALLLVSFFIAVGGLLVGVAPFSKADGDRMLNCGPPLFEVVVPTDKTFDVPENTGCPTPAKQRLIIAGVLVGGVVLVASMTQIRGRRLTAVSQRRWLEGPRRS